jgi:uncharacterized membrane protein YhiD involved in acid resistance
MRAMPAELEQVARLGLALVLGAVIGAERELHDRAAGFRTIILVTVGATPLTIHSIAPTPAYPSTMNSPYMPRPTWPTSVQT